MKKRTDAEWVRLLKQNDRRAVDDLWEMLFTYATSIARWPRYRWIDDSESLARDGAVLAYDKIRTRGIWQYKFAASFPSYCRRILIHEVINLVRKISQPTLELDEEKNGEVDPPLHISGADEIRARLKPCLDRLDSRERDVIDRRFFERKKYEEIAGELGISRNYAYVIAHRALHELRSCLEAQGYQCAEDVLSAL